MKWLVLLLSVALLISPVAAETVEAHASLSFWQQFDITFWQTAPFATLWVYLADSQLSRLMYPGADPHWNAILLFSGIISVGNAFIHASEVSSKSNIN